MANASHGNPQGRQPQPHETVFFTLPTALPQPIYKSAFRTTISYGLLIIETELAEIDLTGELAARITRGKGKKVAPKILALLTIAMIFTNLLKNKGKLIIF